MRPKVCVILPTYNELENVNRVIPDIFKQAPAIPTHDLHVLVVDDDSPDGTQHAVCTLMERFQNLHLITGHKRGVGEAYKRGIDDVMKRLSPDIVLQMDADGQYDPSLIPLFSKLNMDMAPIPFDAGFDCQSPIFTQLPKRSTRWSSD